VAKPVKWRHRLIPMAAPQEFGYFSVQPGDLVGLPLCPNFAHGKVCGHCWYCKQAVAK